MPLTKEILIELKGLSQWERAKKLLKLGWFYTQEIYDLIEKA